MIMYLLYIHEYYIVMLGHFGGMEALFSKIFWGSGGRDEWLRARPEFLVREKEHTRQRDALNADRRRLPVSPGISPVP
jgi:Bacterial protein of unknown function (DUF899)